MNGSNAWPELTIRLADHDEVNSVLYALNRAGVASLVQAGFCVEVGGAKAEKILHIVAKWLDAHGVDSVRVVLHDGTEHVLRRTAAPFAEMTERVAISDMPQGLGGDRTSSEAAEPDRRR